MRIASIHLRNFKRFSDLLIHEIPVTTKLVVIVGPNGCGKSSLFDALIQWYRRSAGFGLNEDATYFRKDASEYFNWDRNVEVILHGNDAAERGSLYIRTAYRNDPDFTVSTFNKPDVPSERLQVNRSIENDQTVASNYQRLIYETMSGVYDKANNSKSVESLRDELIGQVRTSMQNVFGDLLLSGISNPLGDGSFFFEKGVVPSYHFKNLSGGEKAAFDLILDLHVKKRFFKNAIYCIDEVETHLHTRVQGSLLKELVSIVPGDSQLWVTTHSLGVLRAAQELAVIDPKIVSVIDFDGVDPDCTQEIVPCNLGRVSWDKMMSVALDDISHRIAPKVVVICEGSSLGKRRKDFDAEIYNRIFRSYGGEVLFVSGGGSNQVSMVENSARDVLGQILPKSKTTFLVDRDDKSDKEVAEIESKGHIVLSMRNLESFLFADDVIEALVTREKKESRLQEALEIKQNALKNSIERRNPIDDLKSAAGDIYVGLKELLGLQRCGNDTNTFMRDTLAPLIVEPMKTYHELKVAVIEKLPR